ncbi:unnamed protein product [Phytophthora fragariaefolia]|uniref:Unnamed protein product n=1 Tax=Phytophthora fragariaefolia TaxID=1490495 RepID=A0A9W7CYH3_9STRA|nr:unnamed protein product [Phytophthora fragariaefolia]
MSLRFRKHYKSLALGLIDIAIVNSFIVYREACKMRGEPPADHADFITQLHALLLAIGPTEFANMVSSTLESFSSSSNRLCLDVFARPGHTDMWRRQLYVWPAGLRWTTSGSKSMEFASGANDGARSAPFARRFAPNVK